MNNKAVAGLTAGALVAGLLVGLAIGGDGGETSNEAGPGPTKVEAGVPVGYKRSRAGVVRAALNYQAVLSAAVELPPSKRRHVLDAIALPGEVETIASDFEEGYRIVDQAFGLAAGAEDAIVRSGLLGYRLKSYDASEAEVVVWEVAVAAREGTPPAEEGWSTTTLRLRWDSDWKLAGTPERVEGPTPGSTASSELVSTVGRLEEVRYVPAQ